MSVNWALVPMFMLSSMLLAVARRLECSSPVTCLGFACLFFVLGSMGLSGELGWAGAMAVGALYMLVGIPLASIIVSVKQDWFGRTRSDGNDSVPVHA